MDTDTANEPVPTVALRGGRGLGRKIRPYSR